MTRTERLLELLQLLRQQRRPATAQTLAEKLNVSSRSIYRDIATLQAQGAPIEGEAGFGYVLRSGFFLPPLMLSSDELDALILGLRFVKKRVGGELGKAADAAAAKIEAVLPPEMGEASDVAMLAGSARAVAENAHLATIRQAIREEKKLRIAYADKQGEATTRIVWPISVGFFEDAELLAAWCELRDDHRHFRLDSIVSSEAINEKMPRRHRVLLGQWRAARDLIGKM